MSKHRKLLRQLKIAKGLPLHSPIFTLLTKVEKLIVSQENEIDLLKLENKMTQDLAQKTLDKPPIILNGVMHQYSPPPESRPFKMERHMGITPHAHIGQQASMLGSQCRYSSNRP